MSLFFYAGFLRSPKEVSAAGVRTQEVAIAVRFPNLAGMFPNHDQEENR